MKLHDQQWPAAVIAVCSLITAILARCDSQSAKRQSGENLEVLEAYHGSNVVEQVRSWTQPKPSKE